MRRSWVIAFFGMMVVALFAANLFGADEKKMEKNEACAMVGGCGDDMVKAARAMLEECNKMTAKAQELMEKGKTIRGQGLLWGDKQMEADGMNIYDQGKKMYDDAKKLSETCSVIIAEGEKMKNKYKKTGGDQASPTPERNMPPPGL